MPELRKARRIIGCPLLLALAAYVVICSSFFAADRLARSEDLAQLERAARLDPWNASIWRRIAEKENDPNLAIADAGHAVAQNPRDSAAWLGLAFAQQEIGDAAEAKRSLAAAVRADPATPMYAFTAAQLYFSLNEQRLALHELALVANHEPDSLPVIVDLAWRATHNQDLILADVVSNNIDGKVALLNLLIAHDQRFAAERVWNSIAGGKNAFDAAQAFPYLNYLVAKSLGKQADAAWRVLASRTGELWAYRNWENLITNSGFELPILDSALDWRYAPDPGVTVTIAAGAGRNRSRALQFEFSGAVTDPGLSQYVPVTPGAEYDLSAYYRSRALQGANGLAWVALDAASGAELSRTATLQSSEEWQQAIVHLSVSPQSDLVILKLVCTSPGKQLRGTLWLDDVSLR